MKQRYKSGFTLVEMAVVLVIIGLIAASVLAGKQIIEASQARAVMAELRRHMQSFTQFTERYHAYPGDWSNAYSVFKTDIDAYVAASNGQAIKCNSGAGLTSSSFNGNGDNKVLWSAGEGTLAWYHMQLAGLTDNTFNSSCFGTTASVGANIPASNVGGGGFGYFIDYSATMQNYLGLGGGAALGDTSN